MTNRLERMMTHVCKHLAAAAVAWTVGAVPASAHITLESKEVTAGSTAKFVLRVGHGCAGSATTGVRVAIPDGLSEARPQPKPGWSLELVSAHGTAGADGHGHHGAPVKEIAWTGGRLEDGYYDEFVFQAAVDAGASSTLYVPVVQECGTAVERWIEVPSAGGSSDDLKSPAPFVLVQP